MAGQIQAGELRPYSPPIQQQAPVMEPRRPSYPELAPAPKAVEPADPREKFYQDFERKVKNLKPEQKAELEKAFNQRLKTAQKNNQWEEVIHYGKLLKILEKGGTR